MHTQGRHGGEAGRFPQHGRFEGVVGRAGEVLDGGAVGEALGAGGDKGEDNWFNAVVVHLRELFEVDVE